MDRCNATVTKSGGYYAGVCKRIAGHTGNHRLRPTNAETDAMARARVEASQRTAPPAADVTYILVDGEIATLEAFAEDNAGHPDCAAWLAEINAAPVGQTITVGEVRVKRMGGR